jgi:hypothetical protein
MPKTAVNEHRHSELRKNKIGLAEQPRVPSPPSKTVLSENADKK